MLGSKALRTNPRISIRTLTQRPSQLFAVAKMFRHVPTINVRHDICYYLDTMRAYALQPLISYTSF